MKYEWDNIDWIDRRYKAYVMGEIKNDHLKNILNFIYRGGGYNSFLTTDKVAKLFMEARLRGIELDFKLGELLEVRFNNGGINND